MKFLWPKVGDEQIRKGFLFFPVTVENETRWLERATVRWRYERVRYIFDRVEEEWVAKEFRDWEGG